MTSFGISTGVRVSQDLNVLCFCSILTMETYITHSNQHEITDWDVFFARMCLDMKIRCIFLNFVLGRTAHQLYRHCDGFSGLDSGGYIKLNTTNLEGG